MVFDRCCKTSSPLIVTDREGRFANPSPTASIYPPSRPFAHFCKLCHASHQSKLNLMDYDYYVKGKSMCDRSKLDMMDCDYYVKGKSTRDRN